MSNVLTMGYLGHNCKKLGGIYTYNHPSWQQLRQEMFANAQHQLNQGHNLHLVANLSQGVDLLWASVACDLKAQYPNNVHVSVFGASPNMTQPTYDENGYQRSPGWSGDLVHVFNQVVSNPNISVSYAAEDYTSDAVKNIRSYVASSLQYANYIWDGTDSTIGNLIDVSKQKGASVRLKNPNDYGFIVKKDQRTPYKGQGNRQPRNSQPRQQRSYNQPRQSNFGNSRNSNYNNGGYRQNYQNQHGQPQYDQYGNPLMSPPQQPNYQNNYNNVPRQPQGNYRQPQYDQYGNPLMSQSQPQRPNYSHNGNDFGYQNTNFNHQPGYNDYQDSYGNNGYNSHQGHYEQPQYDQYGNPLMSQSQPQRPNYPHNGDYGYNNKDQYGHQSQPSQPKSPRQSGYFNRPKQYGNHVNQNQDFNADYEQRPNNSQFFNRPQQPQQQYFGPVRQPQQSSLQQPTKPNVESNKPPVVEAPKTEPANPFSVDISSVIARGRVTQLRDGGLMRQEDGTFHDDVAPNTSGIRDGRTERAMDGHLAKQMTAVDRPVGPDDPNGFYDYHERVQGFDYGVGDNLIKDHSVPFDNDTSQPVIGMSYEQQLAEQAAYMASTQYVPQDSDVPHNSSPNHYEPEF